MKLSRLYTNQSEIFSPIEFQEGFNVVLARVHHPKDEKKSSHCLGKTLLIDVLDFCLLKTVGKTGHFLKSRDDLFGDLVFYLEIQLQKGDFVTVRRPVREATSISLKIHEKPHQDFTNTSNEDWDHPKASLTSAIRLLDGYLGLSSIKPWNYRKGVSYFMRRQEDYSRVFQIGKFSRGRDRDWKPYVARIFGLGSTPIAQKYEAELAYQSVLDRRKELQEEVPVKIDDYERLRASITIKKDEVERKTSKLEEFDFGEQELGLTEALVNETEARISEVNNALYNARLDLGQIRKGLEEDVQFDLEEVRRIFRESRIAFPDQLSKDYSDLLAFNKRIIDERKSALKARAQELERTLTSLEEEHSTLSEKRRHVLRILGGSESLRKFKELQKELDLDRANVALMQEKAARLEKIQELDEELRKRKSECDVLSVTIANMSKAGSDQYRSLQKTFARIIKDVLQRDAVIYAKPNDSGNLEFYAEFNDSESDTHTQERRGTTYRKILCIAFDLAVLMNYSHEPFYHFVYHDGALEQLENKRKLALLSGVREACQKYEIQYIFSALEEEIPEEEDTEDLCPKPGEIILELHDNGKDGRLFKTERF